MRLVSCRPNEGGLKVETHSKDLELRGETVPPGHTEHIGQVEGEIYEPPAGGCQVRAWEEGADQEALHDGGRGKGSQEDEDHHGITVG